MSVDRMLALRRWLVAVAAIIWREARLRVRDHSALALGLVAPVALTIVVTAAAGSSGSTATNVELAVSRGAAARELASTADELDGFLEVREVADAHDGRALVLRGDVDAALVGVDATDLEVVVADPRSTAGQLVLDVLRAAFDTTDAAAVADKATVTRTDVLKLDGVRFFGPAMAVAFVYLVAQLTMRGLLQEAVDGTLARAYTMGVRPAWILLGRSAVSIAMSVLSLAAVGLVITLTFGLAWRSIASAAVLVVLTAAAVSGVVAFACIVIADGPAEVTGITSVVAVAGGVLGGSAIPLADLPAFLRPFSLVTPNRWAVEGFSELLASAPVDGFVVVRDAAALAAVAVAAAWLAMRRADRLLTLRVRRGVGS